ncbi:high mobility group box domain-containing protein [Fennellomyces sp. T-0311]|nr:high mobility group box domain-containing protein [Fennellomyces sp. T-0311]
MAQSMRNFASLYAGAEDDVVTVEANDDDGNKKRKRRAKKLVDPRQPEKAQSAYNHFIKENYSRAREEDNSDNRGVMTVLAREWKELSADDKKKYQDLAVKDKQRFEREMKEFEAYRKDHPYDAATEGTSVSSKKQKRKLAGASQGSPATEDDDEEQNSSDGEQAKEAKASKNKAGKKEKKSKAASDKGDQAKDGKKKRRNSKSKKPAVKEQ